MNLFYLDGNGCIQVNDPNCVEIDETGFCSRCRDKYYPGVAFAGVIATNNVADANTGLANDTNEVPRSTCQPVPQIQAVPNCVVYSSGLTCTQCDSGFHLSEQKKCMPVDIQTPNCMIHNGIQNCQVCQDGFYLSVDRKQCLIMPSVSNCLAYSNKSCQKCASGTYVTGSNNRLMNQSRMWNPTAVLNSLYGRAYSRNPVQINYNQCVVNDMLGCSVQKDDTNCSTCSAGYYLDVNNVCQKNPYGAITNCSIYNGTPDSCYLCTNLFMRSGTTEPYLCVAVIPITNCQNYDGTVNTSTCTQCTTGFYVANNVCTARKNGAISNCLTYNPKDDSCQVCQSNYQLITNTNGNLCAALGSNCKTLETAAGAYCTTCADRFMPSSGSTSCPSGSITNCQTYTAASSSTYVASCSTCSAGYALIAGACTQVPIITTTAPTNVKCNVDELPIMVSKFCMTNPIAYCSTLMATVNSTCASCVNGYQLNRDSNAAIITPNVCAVIPISSNCLIWDEINNICSQCLTGFLLYKNTSLTPKWYQCVAAWTYTLQSCDTKNDLIASYKFPPVTDASQFTQSEQPCKRCGAGTIPYAQNYSCLTLPTLTTLTTILDKNDFTLISNCGQYDRQGSTTNTWRCTGCIAGYYMSHNTTTLQTITQTCKAMSNFAAETRTLYVNTKESKLYNNTYVDESETPAATTPKIKSRSVASKGGITASVVTNLGDLTIKGDVIGAMCLTTSFTVIDIHNYDYSNTITTVTSTTTQFIDDPDRVTPSVTCVAYAAASDVVAYITGSNPTATTPTCDYYMQNKNGVLTAVFVTGAGDTLYECMKCPLGSYGQIALNTTAGKNRQDVATNGPITSENVNYISSCQTLTNCDSTKKNVYGVQVHWIKLFSCYFCSNGTTPVLIYSAISATVPKFFNWARTAFTATTTDWITMDAALTQPNQICADLSTSDSIRSTFFIDKTQVSVTKMPGCGLAVLNTRYNNLATPGAGKTAFNNTIWGTDGTGVINANAALLCAACSPNFKPTYYTSTVTWDNVDQNTNKDYFVTGCTAIPNCTSNTNLMMNGCQKCDAGFAFQAYVTDNTSLADGTKLRILRTACVKLPDHNPNCYAYIPMSNTTTHATAILPPYGKCILCSPGYNLDTDSNICDKLTVYGCQTTSFVQHISTLWSTNSWNFKFETYFKQFGVSGCNQCQTGLALFSNKNTNHATDYDAQGSTYINYRWTCATSEWSAYLNKTSSWDFKTSLQTYLVWYTYMCSKYEIAKYTANTTKYYQFKYDTLKTDKNTVGGSTNYTADSSNRITTTTGGNDLYQVRCYACAAKYVLSYYYDFCYPDDLLQNCDFAQDYNDCQQCTKTFARVIILSDTDNTVFVAQCVNMSIPNCKVADHLNTNNNIVPQCLTCAAGYYWNTTDNQCQPSNTPNCQQNSTINQCTTCATGYALYANANGISSCFPIYNNSIMNCPLQLVEAVDGTTVTQLAFKCDMTNGACTNGTFAVSSNTTLATSYYACTKYSLTSNCKTVSPTNVIQPITSVSECATCMTNYYLDTNASANNAKTCKKRFVSASNCTTQTDTADTCAALGCTSGFYLTSRNNCEANPIGIYKCSIYDSKGVACTQCLPGFYLDTNGNCQPVTTTIANCTIYQNATTCQQCSQTSSASYYLTTNGTACTLSSIQSCSTWTVTGDKCATCYPGYYPTTDQTACTKATNRIPGCNNQISETKCSQCQNGWSLNLLQNGCVYQNDPTFSNKCINEIVLTQPACVACFPGYTWTNGACQLDNLVSKLPNCLLTKHNDITQCHTCMPGSFMTIPGTCDPAAVTYNPAIVSVMQSRIYSSLAAQAI